MKRFVTYLYECERGNRGKNVGFIRMKVQKEDCRMEVYIRNIPRSKDAGRIYVLLYKEEVLGIELGEVPIWNGQSDISFDMRTEDIMESGVGLNEIVGIGIRLESGGYIVSCWKDAEEDSLARGEFRVWRRDSVELIPDEEQLQETQLEIESHLAVAEDIGTASQEQVRNNNIKEACTERGATYEKIDLSQIRDLPSPNWHLTTNSFLVHGFWNYGYLVLKKEMEEDKEKLSLGIPGIFEKPEAVMAILFGFPSFEEIPSEMVEADMQQPVDSVQNKKNQEAEAGTFGCWFIDLKM
ncbi:MAG: hypothetical protein IJE49_03085 [Agathobacter sp.]|nr:hypothetical protein [Agathobacter sp.]